MELFESFDEGHGFSVGTTQAEQAGQIDRGMLRVSFTLILLVTRNSCIVGVCSKPFPNTCGPAPVSGRLGVGYRLSAYGTNPSLVAFLNCLHIRVTGVREEFAMLINTQE